MHLVLNKMSGQLKNISNSSIDLSYIQRRLVNNEQRKMDALELNILRSHVELNDLIKRVSGTIAVCEHW